MPGDYSRRIFRPTQHYSGVLMQQGRVQLDADWNDQLDIQLHRTQTESIDVIGQSGAPQQGGGFKIAASPDGKDLTISEGRIYVEGLLCELESPSTYITQPYLPNPEFTTAVGTTRELDLDDGHYVVYLDAWQRERTALDDPLIREVALGGPDTTTRIQNIWQVKLLRVSETTANNDFRCGSPFNEYELATTASSGKLNAQTVPPQPEEDPCLLPPTSGYRLLENQLYRVEIHTGTQSGGPITFKWSRDNASVETTVVSIDDTVATVREMRKDELLGFNNNQWVEIVDEESTLKGQPHALVQIDKVQPATREITFKTSLTPFAHLLPGLKLRRWDQSQNADENGLQANPGVWVDIEAGIQVQFSLGTYRCGDHWLIPARTATGEIEWPPFKVPNTQPLPQPPRGVHHHYCRLALLEVSGNTRRFQDCRATFPPLTEVVNFFYVGGAGQEAAPGETLPCPLEVGVTKGQLPVFGVRVRFAVGPGAGILRTPLNAGTEVIAGTNVNGVAMCAWELPSAVQSPQCLQVQATLVGRDHSPALHFNANLSRATTEERGITIEAIVATSDNDKILNDSLVSVSRLEKGVTIFCDKKIDPHVGGFPPSAFQDPENRMAGKPTCFITIDLPNPLHPSLDFWGLHGGIVGFQPLILGGRVTVDGEKMLWVPSQPARNLLVSKLFNVLKPFTDRVLAHLTIKGNFIFAVEDRNLNLDGDVFGIPEDANRIDVTMPSGDGRRGGDLDMWFWLMPEVVDGGRLRLTDVAGTAGNTRSIKGRLLDDAGATVPNAKVKLTGAIGTRSVTTDAQGDFVFLDLPPGTYQLSVQIQGLSAEQTITIG